jgi:hypothetical protein
MLSPASPRTPVKKYLESIYRYVGVVCVSVCVCVWFLASVYQVMVVGSGSGS